MCDSDTTHAFALVGGPADGEVVACTADQYRTAALILVGDEPPEIFAEAELEAPAEEYLDPNAYIRCSDDRFRPSDLKRALGL